MSVDLDRLPECPYSLAIKAQSLKGHTPWSEFRNFGNSYSNFPVSIFLRSRLLCAVFAFVSAVQSRMFVLFCRSRRSFHLHLRCRLHPPGACASDSRGFALLQEVGERFPSLCSALPHVWECVCAGTRTGCFPESHSHATSSAGFPTAPSR